MSIKIKVNPRAARQFADEIEKPLSRKTGKRVKVANSDVRKLQQAFNRLGK